MDDLFDVVSSYATPDSVSAAIRINAEHRLFDGHFPNHPVLPGVCMMRILHDLLEAATSAKLHLSRAGNIKFLHVIDPSHANEFAVQIGYTRVAEVLDMQGSISDDQQVYFKMNASFKVE